MTQDLTLNIFFIPVCLVQPVVSGTGDWALEGNPHLAPSAASSLM